MLNEILEMPVRFWAGCQCPNIKLPENKHQDLSFDVPPSILLGCPHVMPTVYLGTVGKGYKEIS